ncbi:Cytochrome P450 monooxygenase 169 [Psilocybe cubensis]|uniref:Cytochrome P450 monooxygenase 169 n=1 Tax=Psilocybe cubensis TaxID=181762 RepID=A0ACB8HC55_PSICU|nr:Cytochrome P450 monooxygenase 169 [Psilocybe cubensis]KAH9485227.1 Cytochrome P450 monooxygenase 169 [Psilocybe cubensis]
MHSAGPCGLMMPHKYTGNLPEIFQSQAGVPDFKYQQIYGDVVRIKGPFGEDRLLISDPKALQYIFHTSGTLPAPSEMTVSNFGTQGYGFLKWPERTEISRILMGRGLLWADAEIHKRQRKVMLPGFGTPECKAFVPIFRRVGAELSAQWSDILASSPDQSAVFNVASWLSRATMDSIGEAAFDYQFGALRNTDNEFMKAYMGLMSDTLGSPPKSAIFMQTVLPIWILQLRSKFSRSRTLVHARHTEQLANAVTRKLVDSKAEALLQGKGNKDILSLLVKANASETASIRLTDEEMMAQMRTILLAGHETSATTLCWVLLELARHPDVQQRLRNEIRETEIAIHARGDADFTAADLENMVFLGAVIKESMRFHPALYQNYRQAAEDNILPLSKPIKTVHGNYVNEVPIPKGIKIILSIAAYNRNTEIFGEDAHTYNPDRWLRQSGEKKGPSLGVYGNLLTFAGGVRTCIGWRFALYEVFALTVEIINNFELLPTPELDRLRREACLVMLPTLEGEQLKGENLPLRVKLASRD